MRQKILPTVLACILFAGCAATKSGDADDIRFSGYLSSYSGLVRTDDSDLAAFRYTKPSLDLSGCEGILIEKPEARMTSEMRAEIGEEDLAYLLGAFDDALRSRLSAKYRVVSADGPGIVRLRSCITDADSATGVLTPFTRLLPAGIVISTAKKVATGTAANVGKVTAEMELVDGGSGEQLAAAVDRRIGTGVARKAFSNWADVRAVFDVWAERVDARLTEHNLPLVK